jgi:hypothetical protein
VPPHRRDAAEGGAVRPAWWPTSRFGRLRQLQRCDSFPEVIAEKVRRGHAAACATGRLDRKNALRPLDVTLPFVMVDTINAEQAIGKRKQAGLM